MALCLVKVEMEEGSRPRCYWPVSKPKERPGLHIQQCVLLLLYSWGPGDSHVWRLSEACISTKYDSSHYSVGSVFSSYLKLPSYLNLGIPWTVKNKLFICLKYYTGVVIQFLKGFSARNNDCSKRNKGPLEVRAPPQDQPICPDFDWKTVPICCWRMSIGQRLSIAKWTVFVTFGNNQLVSVGCLFQLIAMFYLY